MAYKKIDFDVELPPMDVWAIDVDAVCMDLGKDTYYDLSDQQAITGLRKLRWKLKSRIEALDRELDRLIERNEPTEHHVDENKLLLAKIDRWMREEYPRELEIALAKAGITPAEHVSK